ncbi:hypothetical protein AN960_09905 [Bacillus sp. FJAT-25509]|nr:hypothetical protein AN960_09905 [Bacillus sp. FJAT-25509]
MLKKIIIISTAALAFMHVTPGLNAVAQEKKMEELLPQKINQVLDKETMEHINTFMEEQELTWEEVEAFHSIAGQSLTLESDGQFSFDSAKAIELGATSEQAENMKIGYESMTPQEVVVLKEIEKNEYPPIDPSPTPMVVVIAIPALIAALLALGYAWLVTQILNLGAYAACKKWKDSSSAPKIFKTFCSMKGW